MLMARRLGTIVLSSALASALLLGGALSCHIFTPGACPNPKPSFATIALVFSLGSWLTLFPLVLLLARFMPRLIPALAVPLIATGAWAYLEAPTIALMALLQSFYNIADQVLLAWTAASVLVACVWPTKPQTA
jgi:hypothetical protein